MAVWYILRPFDRSFGPLVYFVVIWYDFPRFGILYQEKNWQLCFVPSTFIALLGSKYLQVNTKNVANLNLSIFSSSQRIVDCSLL
jgi:hypothetical protein